MEKQKLLAIEKAFSECAMSAYSRGWMLLGDGVIAKRFGEYDYVFDSGLGNDPGRWAEEMDTAIAEEAESFDGAEWYRFLKRNGCVESDLRALKAARQVALALKRLAQPRAMQSIY